METKQKFEQWCIVELFGHSKIAGLCTEQNIAGANMLRCDVPETKEQPAFTKFYGSAAIYAINPVDKDTAILAAESLKVGYIQPYNSETFFNKIHQHQPGLPITTDDDNDFN